MDSTELAAMFDALGDATRVKLLHFVLNEEHCVTQCTDHIGLTQSAVSKHLAKLPDAGLVARRPEGRRAYYRATNPAAVLQMFADARHLGDGPRAG